MSEEGSMTPGNWIALLSAVLTLAGVVYSNVHSSQAKELEEENQAKREHLDAYVAMLASQEEQAKKIKAGLSPDRYFSISFANNCDGPIYVAMAYVDFDGSTVVSGWYTIPKNGVGTLPSTPSRGVSLFVRKHQGKPFETSPPIGDYNAYDVTAKPFKYVLNEHYKNGWYELPDKESKHFQRMDLDAKEPGFGERQISEDCHQ